MKRIIALLLAAVTVTGCAARRSDTDARAAELQRKYDAMEGCDARVRVSVTEDGEVRRYTLDVESSGGETRVTVVEPDALAGIGAVVSGDRLTVAYGDMLLDAGGADGCVSVANAADVVLRAAAKGWITEQSTERLDGAEALRLCFETEQGGETLSVAVWFDDADAPLYAEFERAGEIFLYLEFTEFAFRDIVKTP